MRLLLCVFLAAGGMLLRPAAGQTPAPNTAPDQGRMTLWRCELPGGIYEVALRAVTAVSSHEYLVDGIARVTEVNIDTTGSTTVRFYFLEPAVPAGPLGVGQSAIDRVQELAKEAAGKTGTEALWQKVVKNYPTTTHAHTVEYRLESKDQLTKLFRSAEESWRLGRPGSFKAP